MAATAVFLAFAFVSVVTGIGVVFARNAVYSALLLVANFFCLAAFYVMLNAQFLAAVQLTVYAGAIMVLFIFVIMMLSPSSEQSLLRRMKRTGLIAIPLVLVFIAQVVFAIVAGAMTSQRGPYTSIRSIRWAAAYRPSAPFSSPTTCCPLRSRHFC